MTWCIDAVACMRDRIVRGILLACLLGGSAVQAEDYWVLDYQGIEVTAAGSQRDAVNLVRNLLRLDYALVKVLQMQPQAWRPRTIVVALPESEMHQVLAQKDFGAVFQSNGLTNRIVLATGVRGEDAYWNAYFGYSGSLLVSEGALRYPDWYRIGVASVFAATHVTRDDIVIGGYSRNVAAQVVSRPLIPMKDFLRLHSGDPRLADSERRSLRDSQAWLIAHMVLIDGRFRNEFLHYFELLAQGRSEDEAFTESFQATYEQLDRAIEEFVRAGKISEVKVKLADEPITESPRRLSKTDALGWLGYVALKNHPASQYGAERIAQALTADPDNELALRGLLIQQLAQSQFTQALGTVDRLAGRSTLSADGYAESGHALFKISLAHKRREVAFPGNADAFARRGYEDYRHAIAMSPENLNYWASLANALSEEHDKDAAVAFLPEIEQVFYEHPRNSELAGEIARLCGSVDNLDDALKFTVAWRRNAIDTKEEDTANEYLSRLKAAIERRDTARGTSVGGRTPAP